MKWTETRVTLPDGARLRVRERGRPDLPTLIWSHGQFFPMDVEALTPVAEILESLEGWRIVHYDGRGHGGSDGARGYARHRWSSLGEDIVCLAEQMGIDWFVAAGASMGAAASVFAALAAPHRVRGLILSVPPTAWATRPGEVEQQVRLLEALDRDGVEAVADLLDEEVAQWPDDPYYAAAYSELVHRVRAMSAVDLRHILEGAVMSDLPTQAALNTVVARTLVLPVTGDSGHPLSTAETLVAHISGATMQVLESMTPEAGRPIREFLETVVGR